MREGPAEQATPESVLLVEDDPATRGLLARHLRNCGYEVTALESAEQVVINAKERSAPYDVVISDVHLPGMSGIDLASFLLMQRPTQAIVLVTGDPDEALARDALSRGPVSYLLKPFELFELDAAVRQAIVRTDYAAGREPVLRRTLTEDVAAAFAAEPVAASAPVEPVRSEGRGPTSRDTASREAAEPATRAEPQPEASAAEPATRAVPQPEASAAAARPASTGRIPAEWLELVDQRSYAGPGHAARVARLAATLLAALPEFERRVVADELLLAARTHEIGRLDGASGEPSGVAVQGAALLAEAGFPRGVVRAVRHLHERWDGTGGPNGLAGDAIPAGSLLLAIADSLDHYCSAWMQAGMKRFDAVDRAIGLVTIQQSTVFSPIAAAAVHRERAAIRAICSAERPPAGALGSSTELPILRLA